MNNEEIIITVNKKYKSKRIKCYKGDNLFKVLSDAGYVFSGNCGGRGACQRCLVNIAGTGNVKSCQYLITRPIEVEIDDDNISVLSVYESHDEDDIQDGRSHKTYETGDMAARNDGYGIAIDLGTTTVAMELVQLQNGKVMDRRGFMNPQIQYGSDVISRIKYGSEPTGLSSLRSSIVTGISKGITDMTVNQDVIKDISVITVSGNTTMNAILEKLTLENLGRSPFTIKNPEAEHIPASTFFDGFQYTDKLKHADVVCLPNISAFVGADALCGALVCDLDNSSSYQLFADLGTNGELILAKKGVGYATSCACGPAFEGMMKRGTTAPTTAFDLLDTLRKLHVVSDDGVLSDTYIEKGYRLSAGIVIDMDMIRSFLLAKAAICAGVDSLMRIAGIEAGDISKVHLAGGFGCSLKIASAISLGLFPESFQGKSVFSGNTSLYGAHKCLIDEAFIDRIYAFKNTLTAVNLGELENFDKCYYEHMDLRPWHA